MASAVLLDLDRTLVDVQSFTDYDAAWDVVRRHAPADADLGPTTGWTSSTRACMALLGSLPPGETWTTVDRAVADHEHRAVEQSTAMPGVHEFLAALVGRPTAVVTLLPHDVATAVLARHGLEVDVVVGRDPHVRPKPSGDGLRQALGALQHGGDAVMVGDSTWDAAARDAGTRFVGVHAPPSEFAAPFPDVPVRVSLAEALGHL
jgi:phosphoglycolate phosphatase-like HAD superfamily hydrolase